MPGYTVILTSAIRGGDVIEKLMLREDPKDVSAG